MHAIRSTALSVASSWLLLAAACASWDGVTEASAAQPAAFSTWGKHARVGGVAAWVDMTEAEIDSVLDKRVAEHVNVIEADSDLSNYLTDEEFDQQLALMRQFGAAAHARGLEVVWYYPSLEVLTPNGIELAHTMYKDHPDWVQHGLDGTPNVFYGGAGQVFWVDPDTESAWMSPSSPYRDYFIERVSRIVRSGGIDGLWIDVPIYADFGPTLWTDLNPHAVEQFNRVTGMEAPRAVAWNDPVWRRWIAWRHEELARFLGDVAQAVQDIDPEFPLWIETLPTDYNGGTIYGLDGSFLKRIEGLTHVWEVDTMSNATGMRKAREDDWISFISAYKYARAASGEKPSWTFCYGRQANDAEQVMSEALAAGNNPYELEVPEMTTTVGSAYRTRMFAFIEVNEGRLFDARSGAQVAVLYSGASRDYVDQFAGLGMFVTTQSNDDLWWAENAIDSAYNRQYLAEFRGMVKLLVHEHIPFDVVTNPSPGELARFQVLLLPDVEAISAYEAGEIRSFVDAGGHLIATGPNPGGLDEYGAARPDYALADLLGFSKGSPAPDEVNRNFGQGTVRFFAARLGKDYFVRTDVNAAAALRAVIAERSESPVVTDADRRVHFELRETDTELSLQFTNFIGTTGNYSVVPTTFSVTLRLPAGKRATGVALSSADTASPAPVPIPYADEGTSVTFAVALQQYAVAIVTLENGAPPPNRPPVAGDDGLATTRDVAIDFTAAALLANDADPDGDPLTVAAVDAASARGGTIAGSAESGWTYTPAAGFFGEDSFGYQVSDGRGGSAAGTVSVTVAPPPNRPPVAGDDGLATTEGMPVRFTAAGLLANDADPDGDPLTVAAVDAASARGGTIASTGIGAWSYRPAARFNGADGFTYRISDGQGGAATATVTVFVKPRKPVAAGRHYEPISVEVKVGKHHRGSLASFAAADGDRYEVRSAAVAGKSAIEWLATTEMSGFPAAASRLTVTYAGRYSQSNVTQQFYLYDYQTRKWDWLDLRTVGNAADETVTATVQEPQRYISPAGQMRVRIRATAARQSFTCRADLLRWAVK